MLQKAPDNTIFKRVRVFIGPADWSNYTIEADVRGTTRRRQMADIGITAQRYSLVLYGNSQQLKLEPWEPETERTVGRAVRVEGRHVVPPEAARREHRRRQGARARQGLADRRSRSRRSGRSTRLDPIGNRQGAPGFFVDAEFGAYLDNLKTDRAEPMRATLNPCDASSGAP